MNMYSRLLGCRYMVYYVGKSVNMVNYAAQIKYVCV